MSEFDALATMAASTLLVVVALYEDVQTPEDALLRAQGYLVTAWQQIQRLANEPEVFL
jgi:hypothetical protein